MLVSSPDQALEYPVGDLLLTLCTTCGFIQNSWFDPDLVDYTQEYEESQAHSPRFMAFLRSLVDHLVDDLGIRGRTVLDVGCGKGSFLALIAEVGNNHGIGIDPAVAPERIEPSVRERLEFIRGFFDEETKLTGDLVACRHTLEHIPDVGRFTRLLVNAASRAPSGRLYVEVPDTLRILDGGAFWDIYYEHCSYFTTGSLGRLLSRSGARPDALGLGFDDQYVLGHASTASAESTDTNESDVDRIIDAARSFATSVADSIATWERRITTWSEAGKTIVLWGASSKAVAFLTTLTVGEAVRCAVDINPYKHNQYLAGAGHLVVAPDEMATIAPDVVIVMNPIYRDEIAADLRRMGLDPEVATL